MRKAKYGSMAKYRRVSTNTTVAIGEVTARRTKKQIGNDEKILFTATTTGAGDANSHQGEKMYLVHLGMRSLPPFL